MLKPLHIKGLVSSKSSACGREEKRQVCVGWCKMWIDFIKSFDGIVEWHEGNVAAHYIRKKEDEK